MDVQAQNKIKLLFQNLVKPGYVMNSYYTDSLIKKLSKCSDPDVSYLGKLPLVSDLITKAMDHMSTSDNTVKVFIVRSIAIVSASELHFAKIISQQNDLLLEAFKDINSPGINASLRVAFMEVSLALVKHNTGMSWLLKTGVWKEILSLSNEKQTVFVLKQTYEFASKFLWALNDLADEANIKTVLNFILTPLNSTDFLKMESMTGEQEKELLKTFGPMLHMLLAIVSEENRIAQPSLIMHSILQDLALTTRFSIAMDRLRQEEVCYLITKLCFYIILAKVFQVKPISPNTVYVKEDFMELEVIFFNSLQFFTQRRLVNGIVDFCGGCNLIWNTVWQDNKPTWEEEGNKSHIENKILFMLLVPVLVYAKMVTNCMIVSTEDACADEYLSKLLKSICTCEHTSRAAYAMRNLLLELDYMSLSLYTIKRLSCLRLHLSNEQANLVFQALFYTLKEYVPVDSASELNNQEHFEESQEKVTILTYVLDTVLTIVKYHDISWQESLEIICLYSVVHNILKRPNLSCKFVVSALNVLALCVKRFLPPNLSLLLESKPGSATHEIGKLIYMKMHDINWEVRDSALELLAVCIDISYIKFPPFQAQLLDNNLLNVAATMALNDHEFYVQASALKCLAAAAKIGNLWEQMKTQYPNIEDSLISILRNNPEGIVRKEACNALCDVYQNTKCTNIFKQDLYEHMVSSALSDFHWEVQLSALKFWKLTINCLLSDQGMLDGKFPPVTFSRESRKIVTLNEAEVQKRLRQTLEKLSSIGCLTVLVKLLDKDSEVEILEAAMTISLELIQILDKYKVQESIKPNANEPNSVDEIMCNIKEENDNINFDCEMVDPQTTQEADNVIESILNADDINLLSNIYERHMSLSNDNEIQSQPKVKLIKNASPYLFVTFMKSKDLKELIEQKRQWKEGIRSLSSLLDDVLGIYEVNEEVNSLDCY